MNNNNNINSNCGIYKIINLVLDKITGIHKVYIGSSSNFTNRRNKHFKELRVGKHANRHLQSAYNKYGAENFKFEIIEEIEALRDIKELKRELHTREDYWVGFYNANDKKYGYNKRKVADSNLGIKFSDEARIKMSMSSESNEIINLTTEKKFNSARVAEKYCGVNHGSIINACKGKQEHAGGYQWAYADINLSQKYDTYVRPPRGRKIINLTTNKEFKNIKEAARFYGINDKSISSACRGNLLTSGGYKWSYLDEDAIKLEDIREPINCKKSVINLTTGIGFSGMKEAARFYNIKSASSISKACNGQTKTGGGYQWAYVEGNTVEKSLFSNTSKQIKVINLTTGEIFDSIAKAGRAYHTCGSNITRVCKGKWKTAANCKWVYYGDIKYKKEE